MRSVVTITTPPDETRLTTLERVKVELSVTGEGSDDQLRAKIDEATSDIEAHIARTLCRATITETFWPSGGVICAEALILSRYPVAEVVSVTVDGDAVASTEWRIDVEAGLLYRLDASGFPSFWSACKAIVVVFEGGYRLPGEDGRDLPPAIEAAAISLLNSYWQARGRDPMVRAEDIPGLGSVQYWVGAVGEAGSLPPDVVSKIAPFRRPQV